MTASPALLTVIEDIYAIFAPYPLHAYIDGCPCCVGPSDHATIRSQPLRSLTEQDLALYTTKALTTWGNVADFKHFLPRLLELVVTNLSGDAVILADKLQLAHWQQWPRHEREVLNAYLVALWQYVLSCDDLHASGGSLYYAGRSSSDWLVFIGTISDDLSPFLHLWLNSGTIVAYRHLASFVFDNSEAILHKRRLSNFWWQHRPEQMRQVMQWVVKPQIQGLLESAFFAHSAQPYAYELALAADVLGSLRSVRST